MAVDSNTDDSLEALKNSKNSRVHIFIATPDDHINSKFEKQ
jgi:isopropylmalate/homocitrate/citramalate synthase